MALTFGELFAGIGGFSLGFERAGMECKWHVEIEPYAQKVLRKHWPNCGEWDDVRTFPPSPAEDWYVDVIAGGFPCQDISYAGRGAGLEGERSGLFFEAVRVVQQLRPRIVVLENVAALLTRGLDRVLGTLAEIGFSVEWDCIPSGLFGSWQFRDRAFVVAYSDSDEQWRRTSLEQVGRFWCKENAAAFSQRTRTQWTTEPNVGRVVHGVPARVDRLRCLGNAVVPQVAEWIGRRIVEANG